MNPLTKDYFKLVLVFIVMILLATVLASCSSRYTTEQVFIPNDSIIHKDAKQYAFFLDGKIVIRNTQYINVIDDSIGVIVTKTVRK